MVSVAGLPARAVRTPWLNAYLKIEHKLQAVAHVKSRCDGKQSCAYTVSADQLGDPAPGCPKNFAVLYACQGQTDLRLAARAGRAGFDEATVRRVIRLTDLSEYKRRQAATGLKVTGVAFGTGRRMPIAQGWKSP